LSRDGRRLFFASDIPGGFGGFDIYVCEWTTRGWGPPKNLGPEVNSSENELYPFAQGDGMLYFSSSAHGSMGGMDIFSVREVDGKWGFRQRLEEPINSTADDISYTAADANGTTGYVASNRNGKTFDIFSFKSLFPVFSDCHEQEENEYTYIFYEKGSVDLDTTTLKLMWDMGDGTIRYGEEIEHTFPSTGQYNLCISVKDTLTGEIEKQAACRTIIVLDEEQPYITTEETVKAGEPVPFNASKTNLPDWEIEEYYWMFGDGTRKRGMYVEHTFMLQGVYRVQLGVIGKSKYTGAQEKFCVYREILVE
jgi:plastocyanin